MRIKQISAAAVVLPVAFLGCGGMTPKPQQKGPAAPA